MTGETATHARLTERLEVFQNTLATPLKCSFSLLALLVVWLPSPAQASCVPSTSGATVYTCTGDLSMGVEVTTSGMPDTTARSITIKDLTTDLGGFSWGTKALALPMSGSLTNASPKFTINTSAAQSIAGPLSLNINNSGFFYTRYGHKRRRRDHRS